MSNHSRHSPILPCKLAPNPRFMRLGWVTQMASDVQVLLEGIFFKNQRNKKKHQIFPSLHHLGSPRSTSSELSCHWCLSLIAVWVWWTHLLPYLQTLQCLSQTSQSHHGPPAKGRQIVGRFKNWEDEATFGLTKCHWCSSSQWSQSKKGLQHWDHTIGLFLFATIASFKTCFWILGRKHAKILDAACLYNWKNGSPIETLLVWTATLKHWLKRSVQLIIYTLLSLGISTCLSPLKSVRSPRQSAPKLLHSCHDW